MNQRVHRTTKRCPAEHYDSAIGARGLRGRTASAGALLSLLLVQEVLKATEGFKFLGRRYYSPDLGDVPVGSRLIIHFDPSHTDVVHVSIPQPGGILLYLGPAQAYGPDMAPPSFPDQRRIEAEWAAERARERVAAQIVRDSEQRRLTAMEHGEHLGIAAAEAAATPATVALPATESQQLLPAVLPSGSDVTSPAPQDAQAEAQPTESLPPAVLPSQSDSTKPVSSRRRKPAVIQSMPWDAAY